MGKVGELTVHPGSTPSPETHVMQGEGGAEGTFCQQLIDPKEAFLLVAILSLGQDLKQLWDGWRIVTITGHVTAQ